MPRDTVGFTGASTHLLMLLRHSREPELLRRFCKIKKIKPIT
jgi:hypothetical protein